MEVVVSISYRGLAVETYLHNVACVIRHIDVIVSAGRRNIIVNIISCTAVVPFGHIGRIPGFTSVNGNCYEEAVVRTCVYLILIRRGSNHTGIEAENQSLSHVGLHIDGRSNHPIMPSGAGNVATDMVVINYRIGCRECPATVIRLHLVACKDLRCLRIRAGPVCRNSRRRKLRNKRNTVAGLEANAIRPIGKLVISTSLTNANVVERSALQTGCQIGRVVRHRSTIHDVLETIVRCYLQLSITVSAAIQPLDSST